MEITTEELNILKKMSQINNEIKFTSNTVAIWSINKTILAYYDWDKTLDKEFCVGDLPNFLNIIGLYDNPIIDLKEKRCTIYNDGNKKKKNSFNYMDEEIIVLPPTKEEMLDGDDAKVKGIGSSFELKDDDISFLQKQSNLLKSTHIKFEDKTVTLYDHSKANSSNLYEQEIDVDVNTPLVFNCETFNKLIIDDYEVKPAENSIVMICKNAPLTYILPKLKI